MNYSLNDYNVSNFNTQFCYYLAGLIEGSAGHIFVPLSGLPSIQIAFHSKDLPLVLILQKYLTFGSITKKQGAYRFTINNFEGCIKLVKMLNGKFKTVKIHDLNLLISFLNNQFPNLKLCTMPLDQTALNTNAWLSGFIDADGHFFVRLNKKSVKCGFELVQSIEDTKGNNKKDIMIKLAEFLNVQLNNCKKYRVRIFALQSNLKLCSYLHEYPLFSSKFLNFQDYYKVLKLIEKKQHKSSIGKELINQIKNNMNSKRTVFVWDNLQNFYNIYK